MSHCFSSIIQLKNNFKICLGIMYFLWNKITPFYCNRYFKRSYTNTVINTFLLTVESRLKILFPIQLKNFNKITGLLKMYYSNLKYVIIIQIIQVWIKIAIHFFIDKLREKKLGLNFIQQINPIQHSHQTGIKPSQFWIFGV